MKFSLQNEESCCILFGYDMMLLSAMWGTGVSEKSVPIHLHVAFLSDYKYHCGEEIVPKLFVVSDFCPEEFEALVTDVST